MRALIWPVVGFAALVLGAVLGYAAKGIEDDLQAAGLEGLCRPSKSWTAYVAADGDGYLCFKQQIHNKRIIKYFIVEKDIE